jgi:signal transduction histidine kinase
VTVLHAIYALIVAAGLGLTSIVSLAAPSTLRDDDNDVIHVTEAAFIFDATDQPPPDTAPWESQTLPDNWNLSRPGSGGIGWYRAMFTLNDAEGSQAIYINRASMNSAVFVNGILIGNGGSFEEPVARNWNRPSLYVVPQPLMKSGVNVLHVRLRAYPRTQGGLSVIQVGPEQSLRKPYSAAFFFAISLNQLVSLFTFALGILFFLLWTRRRADTVYLYFGVGMMLWGVHGLKLFVQTIPVPAYYWDLFTSLIIPIFTAVLVPFVFRFTGCRHVLLERAGFVAAGSLVVSHIALGPDFLYPLATTGYGVSTLVSAPLLYLLVRDSVHQPNGYRLLVAVAGAVSVGLAIHDLLWQKGMLDFEVRPLLQFGGPLLFLGMGGELLSRFALALTVAETANVRLESRVAQVSDKLAANYRELSRLTSERAMVEERQRIMRDMHDGIGGQLITAISRVRTGDLGQHDLEEVLVEILDDLRLVIDSMQRTENDLASALGNFRYRLEPRLQGIGMALDWQLDGSADQLVLPPSGILHVMRIMQEAFTNILKHSGASRVSVASCLAQVGGEAFVSLRIRDNGARAAGLNQQGRNGYGLANIAARARALGGVANFSRGVDGGCLMLDIPIRQTPEF